MKAVVVMAMVVVGVVPMVVVVGVVMAVVHIGAHLGRLHLLGYQDLLIGYPMAAILVLAGVVLVGSTANA